jgi:AAA-like domain
VRPPLCFVYGNCVFAATLGDAWAAFVASTHTYAGLSIAEKRARFSALMGAVETMEADLQILRVSRPWRVDRYELSLAAELAGPHAKLARGYVDAHEDHLRELSPEVPEVFILVRLRDPEKDVAGYVSQVLEHRPGHWLRAIRRSVRELDARLLTASELERVRVRADRAHARLQAFLSVRPARSVEMQWLVRRGFCRGAGEPQVDGLHEPRALIFESGGEAVLAPLEADVVRWMDGFVEHRSRLLRIESELGVSWQAHLVAGALPERASFPSSRLELMFAPPEDLSFGIDLALCARFLPNELAVRLARRRIQDADQMLEAEAEGEQGPSDQGFERTQQARDLLGYLQSSSRPPLLRATLAIAVGAASEAELEQRVELCRRAYGEVRLHRPLGDQLELFCQHLPGQRTRVRGYDDTLTCEQVAAMMPTAAHLVGSRSGFYLGRSLSGAGRPVRFNLREGSEQDRGTTILSVGALGAGKTTLDQKLKYEAFLQGARIVDCDPKGDHRFHLLEHVAAHVESIALRPDPALRGVLDPLRVAPPHLRQDAAVSFLCDLLPGRAEPGWEAAVIKAVDAVVGRARTPTCLEVVRALGEGDGTDVQVAGTLEVYARGGLTQLAFADPAAPPPPMGTRQVTYLPIRDLPGPEPGTPRAEYSQSERLGEQLVRLIAMFAMHLMSAERERLKVFSFDEGWRLLSDPAGRTLLASLQRMGRSELAVPIISTQLVTDTLVGDRESLHNLLGAIFVFGMRAEDETTRALTLLGMDPDDGRMRRRVQEFDAGRCLFRDHRGRVEAIQVEVVIPGLLHAFSTTPASA